MRIPSQGYIYISITTTSDAQLSQPGGNTEAIAGFDPKNDGRDDASRRAILSPGHLAFSPTSNQSCKRQPVMSRNARLLAQYAPMSFCLVAVQ